MIIVTFCVKFFEEACFYIALLFYQVFVYDLNKGSLEIQGTDSKIHQIEVSNDIELVKCQGRAFAYVLLVWNHRTLFYWLNK